MIAKSVVQPAGMLEQKFARRMYVLIVSSHFRSVAWGFEVWDHPYREA